MHRRFRIGPPKMHRWFCIGVPRVSPNLLSREFHPGRVLLPIAIMKEKQENYLFKKESVVLKTFKLHVEFRLYW